MNSNSYGIDDIKSLSFRDGVRARVNMYLGSDDIDGAYQALKEIINNATDEAIAGYGDIISITINEKYNGLTIRDYGRGVPFGVRENGENVLVSIYSKSHTGGKFDDHAYKNSSGLNGIGAKCVCLSSLDFWVTSYRNDKVAEAYWHKGELQTYSEYTRKEFEEAGNKYEQGTCVSFSPDTEVFKNGDITYSFEKICQDIKDISYLYPGTSFIVSNELTHKSQTYCAKNGIQDFIKDNLQKPLHNHIISGKAQDTNGDKVEIAFQWGVGKENGFVFVNGLHCPEGGSPITGAKTALTRTFNSLSKQNFDGDSIRNGLYYVINCSVAQPSFANQTKSKINNPNLRTLASSAFSDALKMMKLKYTAEFDSVVELMKKVAKAEAAADKARRQVLEATKDIEKNQKKKVFASDKLKDAEYLGENSTLLVVEGNSAAASMAIARDITKYGILAIRGKMLNCLAHPEEKIFQNEEIKTLLSAMNIVPGKYDSKKLRYGKIAICVDADSDGFHIGLLIMSALRYLAPKFLDEGRLCWLRSPLYIVKNGKKETFYFSDEEFNKAKPKGEITRAKGLGALSEQQAKNSMFGENQKMDILEATPDALILLEELMGKDVIPRSEFIFKNIDFSQIRE